VLPRSRPHASPATGSRASNAPQPVTLDAITAGWRLALDAAEDALRASGAPRSGRLEGAELQERGKRLAQERATIAGLLDAIATEHHVRLRRPLSAPRATQRMLGLPAGALACLFDLDGVLTASATIHAAAWAETFDELLARRGLHAGEGFTHFLRPFDRSADYAAYVHGRPRLDGVREFLASRGISLPTGRPGDPAGAETVYGLANRKNEALRRRLEREGVAAFDGSRRYLEAAREAGIDCVVVSASANTAEILGRAGLADLVDERVDGDTIRRGRLRAKPAPDTLLAACRLLGTPPDGAVAFETTEAGIAAARAAAVGIAVAVDRSGHAAALRSAGADPVVADLAELLDPALAA
jgi:beta-phosphoglucomutase family hydrolase